MSIECKVIHSSSSATITMMLSCAFAGSDKCRIPMFLLEFSIPVVQFSCPVDSAMGGGLLGGVE